MLEAEAIDDNTKCRLARASLALGKNGDARSWLAKAEHDSTTPRPSYVMTAALLAVATRDAEAAAQTLDEAVRLASSPVEIDDVVFETTLAMRAVATDGAEAVADRERELVEATKDIAAERKAQLERDPPTADAELEALWKSYPRGLSRFRRSLSSLWPAAATRPPVATASPEGGTSSCAKRGSSPRRRSPSSATSSTSGRRAPPCGASRSTTPCSSGAEALSCMKSATRRRSPTRMDDGSVHAGSGT
jgi:hypothetical protein